MRPVNLYLLTRNQNKNTYTPFENILSARHERVPIKEHEFQSLRHLVDILWQQGDDSGDGWLFLFIYNPADWKRI